MSSKKGHVLWSDNVLVQKFNPNHKPAGSSAGGEFASDGGSSGSSGLNQEWSNAERVDTPVPEEIDAKTTQLFNYPDIPIGVGPQGLAIEDYTGSGSASINFYLRKPSSDAYQSTLIIKDRIANLDKAIASGSTKSDVVLYRGSTDWNAHNWEEQVGKTIDIPSYVSASVDKRVPEGFLANGDASSASYSILVPKGSKALAINPTTGYDSREHEVILPRGSKFHVDKVDANTHEVWMKVVGTDVKKGNIHLVAKFNPNHKPAGSSEGGEFASDGGSGSGGNWVGAAKIDPNSDPSKIHDLEEEMFSAPTPSGDQIVALKTYASNNDYATINQYLRSGVVPLQWENDGSRVVASDLESKISSLDSLIQDGKANQDTIVYRGSVGWNEKNWEQQVGRTVKFDSYTSTTLRPEYAKEFIKIQMDNANDPFQSPPPGGRIDKSSAILYQILLPSGSKALSVNRTIVNAGTGGTWGNWAENEVILPHGTSFHVDKVDLNSHEVFLKVIH